MEAPSGNTHEPQNHPRSQQRPQTGRLRISGRQAELAFDVTTASVSLADIITDVLVALEFYEGGHYGFCAVSLAIFLAAQLSYAFMFTATFAPSASPPRQILVFTLTLPFAQLVPIFAWIESLHFPAIVRAMGKLGLVSSQGAASRAVDSDSDDQLWSAIQSKYSAHAGFLLEAVVEAVPQGLLQTVFVVVYGELTAINALSLAFSLIVLCSKGWIFSYSLHRVTFIFNSLCIVSDVFGLFATVCWLSSPVVSPAWNDAWLPSLQLFAEQGGSSDAAQAVPESFASELTSWWIFLASSGLALSYVGGFFLLFFANFDDHLKLTQRRDAARLHGAFDNANWVGPPNALWIYTYRTVGFVLACMPCTVVWLTAKLAWLPVSVFKSFDPEHATHARFYRALFELLRTGRLPHSVSAGGHTPSGVAIRQPDASTAPGEAPEIFDAEPPSTLTGRGGAAVTEAAASAADAVAVDVSAESTTERLLAVNSWTVHARGARAELSRRLEAQASANRGWRQRVRADEAALAQRASEDQAVVAAWAAMVGARQRRSQPQPETSGEEELDLAALLLIINQGGRTEEEGEPSPADTEREEEEQDAQAASARVRLRRAMVAAAMAERRAAADASLMARSEVIRWVRGRNPAPVRPAWAWLRWCGVGCLLLAGLFGAVWTPVTLAFWLYSWAYPLLMLPYCFDTPAAMAMTGPPPTLACALSSCKVLTILGMALLVPAVRKWQAIRLDLVGMAGFAPPFYSDSTLAELERRVNWADRSRRPSTQAAGAAAPSHVNPEQAFDSSCSICLEPLLRPASSATGGTHERSSGKPRVAVALPLCLHAFHEECIYHWLQSHRNCPNCRQEVTATV